MALAERYVILFPLGRGKALRRRRHRTRSASPRGLFTVLVAGDTSTHDGGHKALSSGIFLPREIDSEPTQPKHPGHPASGTLRIAAEMPVSIVYGDGGAPKTR